ncbi:MAG: hypothetical protein OEM97_09510 [Acidimicrobiia bacterium]|nr:hypothetical protein [Acidimicrobiia bacterium]
MCQRTVSIVVAFLLAAATPAFATPGDVVADYGVDGTHVIADTGGRHWIGEMAVRPTGEAILTGSSVGTGSGEQAFWVTEVAADGMSRQDATDIGLGAAHEMGTAISLQPDGSFFVAGERGAVGDTDTDMFVASFDADGALVPGFGIPPPGAADGVQVLFGPGIERTTSVFRDGSNVVVGGWRDTFGEPGVVWRLQSATGLPDQTFGTGGKAELIWGAISDGFDRIETTVWPTSGTGYLAIGVASSGEVGEVAAMAVSDIGLGGTPMQLLAGAIEHYDTIPLHDGTVAVATQLFSAVEGSVLVITKVGPDGSVVWQTPGLSLAEFAAGVTITELRDGSFAAVASSSDLTHRVYHYDANGTFTGTIVTPADVEASLGAAVARAAGVAVADGGLYVTSVVDPADGSSISGVLAVTEYIGDDSGRFVDDDGNTHEANIERLADAAITGGCDPDDLTVYCPSEAVTRAQMATFLVNAANIAPAPGFDPFTDDDGNTHETNIGAVAAVGVTVGCDASDPSRYCPDDKVPRGQMATFLVRAFDLGSQGTTSDPGPFTDDDGSVHEASIAILHEAGITAGCDAADPTRYCPLDPVTRAQMASFIMRTLDHVGG